MIASTQSAEFSKENKERIIFIFMDQDLFVVGCKKAGRGFGQLECVKNVHGKV